MTSSSRRLFGRTPSALSDNGCQEWPRTPRLCVEPYTLGELGEVDLPRHVDPRAVVRSRRQGHRNVAQVLAVERESADDGMPALGDGVFRPVLAAHQLSSST